MSYDDENRYGEDERRRRRRSEDSDARRSDSSSSRRRSAGDGSGRSNADGGETRRRSAGDVRRVNTNSGEVRRRSAGDTGRTGNANGGEVRRRSAGDTGRTGNANGGEVRRRQTGDTGRTGNANGEVRRRQTGDTGRTGNSNGGQTRRRSANGNRNPNPNRAPRDNYRAVSGSMRMPGNGPVHRDRNGNPTGACKAAAFITSIVTTAAAVFLALMIVRLGMLTVTYTAIVMAIMAVLVAVVWILSMTHAYKQRITRTKQKVIFVLSVVFAVLFTLIFAVGGVYILKTGQMLRNNSGVTTETSNYHVYVLNDDDAESLEDAKDYTFGILEVQDRDNVNTIIDNINEELGSDITTVEYPGMTGLADALKNGEVQAIILCESFMEMYSGFEGYETFSDDVKIIWTGQITSEIETVSDEFNEITTIYISGSDTREDTLPSKGLSDVNIILRLNFQTHQALIISTPRDYYVTTPVSGSDKDKLTQAGVYGVQNSIGTLENLYDCDIDYYVRMNFNGFVDIIDALGGVTVWSDNTFTTGNMIGYTVYEGYNEMDGMTALAYCRERYAFSDGDNQRGRNQMEVLKAIINKCTDASILSNYLDVIDSVDGCFETSIPYNVMADMVKAQVDYGGDWDVVTYSVTGSGASMSTYSHSATAYVMIPDDDMVDTATGLLADMAEGKTVVDPDETEASESTSSAS